MKLEPIGTVVLRAMSAAVLIAVGTTAARSDPEPEAVTFHFEGAVSAVDVFSPSSDLGDFVTGSITFDPSTPATLDSPTRNVYFDAVTRFRFWTNGEEGIARQFDCGDAQTFLDWSEGTDLLHFSCMTRASSGLVQRYNLATFGAGMLDSLDLPEEPPAGERVDFFWGESGESTDLSISSNLIDWTAEPTRVEMNVRPGDRRNRFDPSSPGAFWVALLSDNVMALDPLQIDVSTVRLWPAGAAPERDKVQDANDDGVADLLLRFELREGDVECSTTELALTGRTFAGDTIDGADAIRAVGCDRDKR